MPTSFVDVSAQVSSFAGRLAVAARIFTLPQLARHPELSWRSHPVERAREFMRPHRDAFETVPWLDGHPHLWRLTTAEKRRRGVRYRNVGASQHTPHWLAIGDLWMTLVFAGLRPEKWFTEGKAIGGFDVFCMIRKQPFLIEVQNTPLSERQWHTKWHQREEWLRQQKWRSNIVLVTTQDMRTQGVPSWVNVARMDSLPKAFTNGSMFEATEPPNLM